MLARKKPVTVEVRRWTANDSDDGDSFGNDSMACWLGKAFRYIDEPWVAFLAVDGRELFAHRGDYVARQETFYGPDFWPIAPLTFEQTYDLVTRARNEDERENV